MSADEWALPLDAGVTWCMDTSGPLLVHEAGNALLLAPPHSDDPDRRNVAIRAFDCRSILIGPPGREARSGHRLWERGLSQCTWAAEVTRSRWVAAQERMDSLVDRGDVGTNIAMRHWVLLFKEVTVECVGRSLTTGRLEDDVQVVWLP